MQLLSWIAVREWSIGLGKLPLYRNWQRKRAEDNEDDSQVPPDVMLTPAHRWGKDGVENRT